MALSVSAHPGVDELSTPWQRNPWHVRTEVVPRVEFFEEDTALFFASLLLRRDKEWVHVSIPSQRQLSSENCLLGNVGSRTAEGTAGLACFGRAVGQAAIMERQCSRAWAEELQSLC